MAIYTGPTLDGMIAGKPSPTYKKKSFYTARRGDSFYSISRKTGTSARTLAGANPRVRKVRAGQRLTVPGSVRPQSYRPANYALPQGVQNQIGQQQAGWGMGNPFRGGAPQNLQPQYNPYAPALPAQRWGQQFVGSAANLPGGQQFRPNTYSPPAFTNVPGAGNLPQNVAQQVGQQIAGWTGPNQALQLTERQKMVLKLQQANANNPQFVRGSPYAPAISALQVRNQQMPPIPGLAIRGRGQEYAQQLLDTSFSGGDPNNPNSKYGALMRQIYEQQPDIMTLIENNVLPNLITAADIRNAELAGYDINIDFLLENGYIRDEYGNWYNTDPKDLSKYIDQGGGGGYRRTSSRRSYGGRGRYASSPRSSGSRGYMAGTEAQYNPTLLGLTSWRI
ncbi:MAG: LysM peptidoglycan-binding domain-containing protein [bacterium]